MPKPLIAEVFRKPPQQWGLRGDPGLWQALSERFGSDPLPETESEFEKRLRQSIEALLGHSLDFSENVSIEKFDKGGLSGGAISLIFWREQAIPLLCNRYQDLQALTH